MAHPSSLQVLVELAEHRSHAVARNLGLLINRGEEGEAKLQMLRNYLQEYRTRLDDSVREGLEPERLRNYLAFIARLERAIADQAREVAAAKACIDGEKVRWIEKERERRSFEILLERRHQEGKRREAKSQQKQDDEIAARTGLGSPDR